MEITLYQNCRLNKNYQEVFALKPKILNDNTTIPLVAYLNTLVKKIITIDNVFSENKGILIFDYSLFISTSPIIVDEIYSFNYMKITFNDYPLAENFVRYCFIDKIEVRNELVYLYYSEDYWHSYSNKIKGILPSHLISSRVTNYANSMTLLYAKLKEDYDSFYGLYVDPQFTGLAADNYDIIIQIQPYKMITYEQNPAEGNRKPYYMLIRSANDTRPIKTTVINLITSLISNVSSGKIELNNEDYYYDIGDIYLFPAYFNIDSTRLTTAHTIKDEGGTAIAKAYFMSGSGLSSNLATKSISLSSYKTYEIGTLNTRLKIVTNKLANSSNLNIKFEATQLGIGLFIEFQGQFANITDDYCLKVPIKAASATEYKLEKLNHQLEKSKTEKAFFKTLTEEISLRARGIKSAMQGNVFVSATASSLQMASDEINNSMNRGLILDKLELLNKDAYAFNYGVFGNTDLNILNCFYGLFIFEKTSKNDIFVKGIINNYGYDTDLIIDNNNLENLKLQDANYFQNLSPKVNYNVVQFEKANVYGSFTNEIANILNNILENGVKIWYDYTTSEDAFPVG